MSNLLQNLIDKKIENEDFYNSKTIITNKNHFIIELLLTPTKKQIGLHLNEDILFTIKGKTLSVIKYNNSILFTKRIDIVDNLNICIKYDNNVLKFGYKEEEEETYHYLNYTYVDYSKKYIYGIYGQKNTEFINLKLLIPKPEKWTANKNQEYSINNIYLNTESVIYIFEPIEDKKDYCIEFDIDEDIYVKIGEEEQRLINAGTNKQVYFSTEENIDITFISIKPVNIKNISILYIDTDNYTSLKIPLTDIEENNPLAIGFDFQFKTKEDKSFNLNLFTGADGDQELFDFNIQKNIVLENQTTYYNEEDESQQFKYNENNSKYYIPNKTEAILKTLDYAGKLRIYNIDLTEYDELFTTDKYFKLFVDFQIDKTLLNIETYETFNINNIIENDNKYEMNLSISQYNYLRALSNNQLFINNEYYSFKLSNIDTLKLISNNLIPEGLAIIPETKQEIIKEINANIILNSDIILNIADLTHSNNISEIDIDNLFILNQNNNNEIFKSGRDNIIDKSLIYFKFNELNTLQTKCIALNNIDPLKPLCIKAFNEEGEILYQEVFSREKNNSVVQKKNIILTKDDNKFFLGNDLLWVEVKALNKISYYIENGYIIFTNTENIEDVIDIEIKYIQNNTFCVNIENDIAFITIVNPQIGLNISFSEKNTSEINYIDMNLNPFYSANNNGFIYIGTTNRLKYIQFISTTNKLIMNKENEIFVEVQLFGENHSIVNDVSLKLEYEVNDYFDAYFEEDTCYKREENQSSKKILKIKSKSRIIPEEKEYYIKVIDTKTGINNSFKIEFIEEE